MAHLASALDEHGRRGSMRCQAAAAGAAAEVEVGGAAASGRDVMAEYEQACSVCVREIVVPPQPSLRRTPRAAQCGTQPAMNSWP